MNDGPVQNGKIDELVQSIERGTNIFFLKLNRNKKEFTELEMK